mgnify:CR=1 FL=1
MMIYTHWQYIYSMYYASYLHEDIHVLYNNMDMKIYMYHVIYLYEDTMYYEICVCGDVRVLCNMATCRHTCIM